VESEIAPCFLVAAPSLACPFFNHTVVLLVDHRDDGSLGFVVNKPADIELGSLLDQIGVEVDITTFGDEPVMLGGPVSPETGWVVFDPSAGAHPDEGILTLAPSLGVSANLEVLEEIAKGSGPERYLMMLGYAGWGPGQLDEEIREGSWIAVDLDPQLVFRTPVEERWAAALATLGIDPARMAATVVADA
jgi:putative transcriptional regulator